MASCFCTINLCGNSIIYHTYRNDVDKETVLGVFRNRVLLEDDNKCTPVFVQDGYTYTYIRENNVYLLMVSAINCLPLMQLEFLRCCVRTWKSYFSRVNENSIRDNFVIIYELLDEMSDFGYPQFTDEKVLKSYITEEGVLSYFIAKHDALSTKLPAAVRNREYFPWRPSSKTYAYTKNEIFFDIEEEWNAILSIDGSVLSSDVKGKIMAKSFLSGMPEVMLLLNDTARFDLEGHITGSHGITIPSIQFHPCVNLQKFQKSRKVAFTPPDGSFELCSYCASGRARPPVKMKCTKRIASSSRITMAFEITGSFPIDQALLSAEALFPIPCDAHSFQVVHCTGGTCMHDAAVNKIVWRFPKEFHWKEKEVEFKYDLPTMRCKEKDSDGDGPIEIRFEALTTASGIVINQVSIKEGTTQDYQSTPWVRSILKNGQYCIRQ